MFYLQYNQILNINISSTQVLPNLANIKIRKMSANLIRNDDYTSLDFLQQLLPTGSNSGNQNSNATPNTQGSQTVNKVIQGISNRTISINSNGNIGQNSLSNSASYEASQDRSISYKNIQQVHNGGNHSHAHSHTSQSSSNAHPHPYSTSKLIRTHSLIETHHPEQKQRTFNNFKQFYDVIVKGQYQRQQADNLWRKFQTTVENSYQFQHFIWQTNKKKDVQLYQKKMRQEQMQRTIAQLKNKRQIQQKQLTIQKQIKQKPTVKANSKKYKSRSCICLQLVCDQKSPQKKVKIGETVEKQSSKKPRAKSAQPRTMGRQKQDKNNLLRAMKKQIGYIRRVIQHGEKFIHS